MGTQLSGKRVRIPKTSIQVLIDVFQFLLTLSRRTNSSVGSRPRMLLVMSSFKRSKGSQLAELSLAFLIFRLATAFDPSSTED